MFSWIPSVDLGFWMPSLAILSCAGVFGSFAYMTIVKPAEFLQRYGYNNIATSAGNVWPLLVSYMRITGTLAVNITLIFLYFLYEAVHYGWVPLYSMFICLLFVCGISGAAAYRIYVEDPKSKNNSDISVAAQQKNLAVFGSLAGFLVLAMFFKWLWSGPDGDYVVDSYHGLPDELQFLKKSASRFLKQHFIGHL